MMLFYIIALGTLLYTHLFNTFIECRLTKFDHILLEKKFGAIDKCSDLQPESVNATTVCMSSCAISSTDPQIKCNISANTWDYDLVLENPATFSTPKGYQGCSINESRYKCIAMRNDSKECDQITHLNPGDHCYTSCGEEQCPNGRFKPTTSEDYKKGDCKDGYRIRCEALEKMNVKQTRKFTVEMSLNRSKTL